MLPELCEFTFRSTNCFFTNAILSLSVLLCREFEFICKLVTGINSQDEILLRENDCSIKYLILCFKNTEAELKKKRPCQKRQSEVMHQWVHGLLATPLQIKATQFVDFQNGSTQKLLQTIFPKATR